MLSIYFMHNVHKIDEISHVSSFAKAGKYPRNILLAAQSACQKNLHKNAPKIAPDRKIWRAKYFGTEFSLSRGNLCAYKFI